MSESIALIKGRVIDPETSFDQVTNVLIEGGKIAEIGSPIKSKVSQDCDIIYCTDKIVCPGFIDVHVHGRTPGQTHKETLGSLALAAIAGGFTTVVCMANTNPSIDNTESLKANLLEMEQITFVDMFQVAAVTKQRLGQELTNFQTLAEQGAIAFSDDGDGIQDPSMLYLAMLRASQVGRSIFLHCQDKRFEPDDERAEIHDVSLALRIAEAHDLPVHLQHISCAASVELIKEAKVRGVKVTCETAPHYISLTVRDFRRLGADAKMNPPLKKESDRRALVAGLKDRTIDLIATDHAPHTPQEKAAKKEEDRPYGVIGLETAVPVAFTSLEHHLDAVKIIEKMTLAPAKLLGLKEKGRLQPGLPADLVVIDPKVRKVVNPETFYSLGRNCPWTGKRLQGWPVMTIRNGKIMMRDGEIVLD